MDENQKLYQTIEIQESMLQFQEFTAETALTIGLALLDRAKKEEKSIAITIIRSGMNLFHYAMDGTSPDNDGWIAGKNYLVNRFHRSSLYMAKKIRSGSYPKDDNIGPYVAGGAFPIIIKNVGVIGTITISGLDEKDDHGWVVEIVRNMLGIPECPML